MYPIPKIWSRLWNCSKLFNLIEIVKPAQNWEYDEISSLMHCAALHLWDCMCTLKVRDQVPSDLLLCDSYLSRTGEFLWICKVGKTLEWLSLIRRPRAAWAAKNINEYLYHFHYDCAKGNHLLQYRFTILICWHHIECMRMSRPPYWRCCLWLSRSLPPPSHPQPIPRHKWQNKITFPTCQCVKNRPQATMPYL